jgi:SWIM zinc finger
MESESNGIVCSTFEASTRINKKKGKLEVVNNEEQDEVAALVGTKGSTRKSKTDALEKRLRIFRKRPPKTYLGHLGRVRTQRMFLIDRERKLSEDGRHEVEVFDIAGTTGNIYQVTITKRPSCTCPDAAKGSQCKHIIYMSVFWKQTRFLPGSLV